MPELPEVETIARDLDSSVSGARIIGVSVRRPDVLREVTPRQLVRRLDEATIAGSWRRAKLVVVDLSTSDRIVVQPRFTGAFIVEDGTTSVERVRYSTVQLRLADGRSLHYCDVRRLGTFALMNEPRFAEYAGALGHEPLDETFTPARLSAILRGSSQAVKKILMDQYKIAGVGNIYANEALWRSRIDPSRAGSTISDEEAGQLHRDIVDVLTEAIRSRGTTFRDYRDAHGEEGEFAGRLAVYGRGGESCPRCGYRLVTTHAIDGRATTICARCQR